MPAFVPVSDVEAPRSEQKVTAETLKHRKFDNPHSLNPIKRGWQQGTVGWGVQGAFGSSEKDDGTAVIRHGDAGKMIKNEKGLWVKVKDSGDDAATSPSTTSQHQKSVGRGGGKPVFSNEGADLSRNKESKSHGDHDLNDRYNDNNSDHGRSRSRNKSLERPSESNKSRKDDRRRSRSRDRRKRSRSSESDSRRSSRSRSRSRRRSRSRSRSRSGRRHRRSHSRGRRYRSSDRKRRNSRDNRRKDYHSRDRHRSRSRDSRDDDYEGDRRSSQKQASDRKSSRERNRSENEQKHKTENVSSKMTSKDNDKMDSDVDENSDEMIPMEFTAIQVVNRLIEVFSDSRISQGERIDAISELFSNDVTIRSLKNDKPLLEGKSSVVDSYRRTQSSENCQVSKRVFITMKENIKTNKNKGNDDENDMDPEDRATTWCLDLHRPGSSPGLGDPSRSGALLYSCQGPQIINIWGIADAEDLATNGTSLSMIQGSKVWTHVRRILGKRLVEFHFHDYDRMETWG